MDQPTKGVREKLKRGRRNGTMSQHAIGATKQMERGDYNLECRLQFPISICACPSWKRLCDTCHTYVKYDKYKYHTRVPQFEQIIPAVNVEHRQILKFVGSDQTHCPHFARSGALAPAAGGQRYN